MWATKNIKLRYIKNIKSEFELNFKNSRSYVYSVWQMRDFQKYCWRSSSKYLFFWTWTRLLPSLMTLFLYKCIKFVVIHFLKWCVCTTLSLFIIDIFCYIQTCLFPSHCSAVFEMFVSIYDDEILTCCWFAVCQVRVGVLNTPHQYATISFVGIIVYNYSKNTNMKILLY